MNRPDPKGAILAEIARIKALPDARGELTKLLAKAQVLQENMAEQLAPLVATLATMGADPDRAQATLDEFPAWAIAQIEQAIAELPA